jgi:DNA polymerase III subunit delta'
MLQRLVHLGHGSPGQALALADPSLWDFRRVLVNGLAQPRPNSVELSTSLLEFVADAGKDKAPQRRRASQVLRLLIQFFDDALAVRLVNTSRLGDPEELAMLDKMAVSASPEKLLNILDRCIEADLQIGRYVQLDLVLEALLDALGVALTAK